MSVTYKKVTTKGHHNPRFLPQLNNQTIPPQKKKNLIFIITSPKTPPSFFF